MTDKQIIIDGIDVSGCEKQGETIAGITCGNGERIRLANEIITKHKLCKDNPNCVYKQFKRKEQELQEAMDNYVQLDLQRVKEYNELVDLYKAKEQECEEFKKKLMQKSEVDMFFNTPLEGWSNDPCEICKYKQTLAEIKEIAEGTKKDICNNCSWKNTDSCVPEDYTCGELIKILQKISECEVEK